MKTFKDKTIVITGASSGIGEAMARVYAAQGARVVLGARNAQRLEELVAEIRTAGGQAAWCAVDVTDAEQCKALIDTAVATFGGIDVLICNAGISMRALFDDVDLAVLRQLMDVNFWGTVNCCKYALPYVQASHGSIVGISSVAGLHGLEVCHDRILGDDPHRESQKGIACDGRLPGIHGFECAFRCFDCRRFAAGRNPAQRGEDDDARRGRPHRRPRHPAAQAAVSDSLRHFSTGCSIG